MTAYRLNMSLFRCLDIEMFDVMSDKSPKAGTPPLGRNFKRWGFERK